MTDDLTGKLVADKYRIERLIRENDAGDLYTARHEIMDRPVMLSILAQALAVDIRWARRFIDDARLAAGITHPNVLNINDFGTDAAGVSYAVFETFESSTLADAMKNDGEIDSARVVNITRQIAAAVSAAHTKKIVHGGLNPDFVLVNDDDVVKVFGFGPDNVPVARRDAPEYVAPEYLRALPGSDERLDVFSVGVMLYEMLSGVVPFAGQTSHEVLAKHESLPPAPLSAFRQDLHPALEPIILTAIADDPERRYPTMAAFLEDLEKVSGKALDAKAMAVGSIAKRSIWQGAFVVVAGIAILAAAFIWGTSARQTDPTENLQADVSGFPVQPIGPATGAQEESLAKLPAMTEAEILAATMMQNGDMLPGGDGYNAWANGGVPPAGAPLNYTGLVNGVPPVGYVPPGGQYYTVEPGQSQFMPMDSGVILVPVPANTQTDAKPSPTPKAPAGNTAVQPTPAAAVTPKPLLAPPTKGKPATTQPDKDKPTTPATKPAKTGKATDSE